MPPDDPEPDSHEPAGRVDVPGAAPEWAVNVALEEFDKDRIDLGFVDTLARLLATLRERTLREAAGVCGKRADEFNRLNVEGGMGKAKSYQHGQEAMACGGAILSLIAQPPKEA